MFINSTLTVVLTGTCGCIVLVLNYFIHFDENKVFTLVKTRLTQPIRSHYSFDESRVELQYILTLYLQVFIKVTHIHHILKINVIFIENKINLIRTTPGHIKNNDYMWSGFETMYCIVFLLPSKKFKKNLLKAESM